jgi:hypothetical protein
MEKKEHKTEQTEIQESEILGIFMGNNNHLINTIEFDFQQDYTQKKGKRRKEDFNALAFN